MDLESFLKNLNYLKHCDLVLALRYSHNYTWTCDHLSMYLIITLAFVGGRLQFKFLIVNSLCTKTLSQDVMTVVDNHSMTCMISPQTPRQHSVFQLFAKYQLFIWSISLL